MMPAPPSRKKTLRAHIYDVSAYSFWSAPLGLLQEGSILREAGMHVSLLDCLAEDEGKAKSGRQGPLREAEGRGRQKQPGPHKKGSGATASPGKRCDIGSLL